MSALWKMAVFEPRIFSSKNFRYSASGMRWLSRAIGWLGARSSVASTITPIAP